MKLIHVLGSVVVVLAAVVALILSPVSVSGQTLTPQQQFAHDVYKELIEINTVTPTGDTGKAADAMAARLRAAGFPDSDIQVFKPAPRKGNLVARLRGTGARKPILLLAHLDVVEARREDWSFDPFKLHRKGRLLLRPRHRRRQIHGCRIRLKPDSLQARGSSPIATSLWHSRRMRRLATATRSASNGSSRTIVI